MQTLSQFTARQLEIEQVRRAYTRGVQTLADLRAAVVAAEAKQAARLAEIERQLAIEAALNPNPAHAA